jgi:hypothetical protein
MIENRDSQFGALAILGYLSDLFTAAGKPEFNQVDILIILAKVKEDPDIFDPLVVAEFEERTADVE